jgi:hypothetical protein
MVKSRKKIISILTCINWRTHRTLCYALAIARNTTASGRYCMKCWQQLSCDVHHSPCIPTCQASKGKHYYTSFTIQCSNQSQIWFPYLYTLYTGIHLLQFSARAGLLQVVSCDLRLVPCQLDMKVSPKTATSLFMVEVMIPFNSSSVNTHIGND